MAKMPSATEHNGAPSQQSPMVASIDATESPRPSHGTRLTSFDAAAVQEWREHGIALAENVEAPPSSPTSSPTLVGSAYSPTAASTVTRVSGKPGRLPRLSRKVAVLDKVGDPLPSGLAVSQEPMRGKRLLVIKKCIMSFLVSALLVLVAAMYSLNGWQRRVSELNVRSAHCSNPYAEPGRLEHSARWPDATRWRPFQPTCRAPPFLATLRAGLATRPAYPDEPPPVKVPLVRRTASRKHLLLPWLADRTVVLIGDHVERVHLSDFCRYVGGQYAIIDEAHLLSPPPFVNGIDEKWQAVQASRTDDTRPTVCFQPEYGLTLVNVSHYGLANRVEFERETLFAGASYHPPAALRDRLDYILSPLLTRLELPKPDLVEFASGFWDLRHLAAVDNRFGLPLNTEISEERLVWYARRLVQAFGDVAALFPRTSILWRPLYTTPQYDWAYPVRSAAVEQLARQAARALNESTSLSAAQDSLIRALHGDEQGDGRRTRLRGLRRSGKALAGWMQPPDERSRASFLKLVKERVGDSDKVQDVRPTASPAESIKGLIRINEWSNVLRGRERLEANPGSFVWADVLLFELWRVAGQPP